MSAFDIPAGLKVGVWGEKQKTKATGFKLKPGDLAKALADLVALNAAVRDELLEPGPSSAAEAEAAIKRLDSAVKAELKNLRAGIGKVEEAADAFVAAAKKLKLDGQDAKDAAALIDGAAAISKAGAAFDGDVGKKVDAARAALVAEEGKLKAKEKKGPATGAKPVETKASKFVRAKVKECIRQIKKPMPGAKPWRFIVVKGTTSVTVCMLQTVPGGSHEKMLKSLIPTEKTQTLKDAKGEVIWEKNAITLVSDRLPMGLAKKMQEWLKKLTKINARVRIRKTTGEVEESAEGEDIPDELLKVDPTEAADKVKAGKEFATRLGKLMGKIKAAKEKLPDDLKAEMAELIQSIGKHGQAQAYDKADEDLDALEALIEEEGESTGEAPGSTSSAEPGSAAPAGQGLSVRQLAVARLEWIKQRDRAVAEINHLVRTLVSTFSAEPEQKAQVKKAVEKFVDLERRLKVDLERQLEDAFGENDPAKRARLAATAKQTLRELQALMDKDAVVAELDGNELMPDMNVVAPMRDSLRAIEAALG